jgi:hypothetical protein
MEKELAPLLAALEDAKKKVASEKKVPSYGTLKEWAQARADALTIAARGARRGDRMLTPAQVEVDLSGSLFPGCSLLQGCMLNCPINVAFRIKQPSCC